MPWAALPADAASALHNSERARSAEADGGPGRGRAPIRAVGLAAGQLFIPQRSCQHGCHLSRACYAHQLLLHTVQGLHVLHGCPSRRIGASCCCCCCPGRSHAVVHVLKQAAAAAAWRPCKAISVRGEPAAACLHRCRHVEWEGRECCCRYRCRGSGAPSRTARC